MNIKDITKEQSKIDVTGTIVEKGEPRAVNLKAGGQNILVNTILQDNTGRISLTLWGDTSDTINLGDVIKITNGYTKLYNAQLSLSVGKYGKLEKV